MTNHKIVLSDEECTDIIDALIYLTSEVCCSEINDDKMITLAKKIKDTTGADCKNTYIHWIATKTPYKSPDHMEKVKEWFDIRIDS